WRRRRNLYPLASGGEAPVVGHSQVRLDRIEDEPRRLLEAGNALVDSERLLTLNEHRDRADQQKRADRQRDHQLDQRHARASDAKLRASAGTLRTSRTLKQRSVMHRYTHELGIWAESTYSTSPSPASTHCSVIV